MQEVDVNLVGVLAAAVVAMIIGAVWYSKPLFGVEWMRLTKLTEKQAQKGAPVAMTAMAIMAIVTAGILAHFAYLSYAFFDDSSFFEASVVTSFWAWLGFVLYAQLSNGMFEQRPRKLVLINVGNSLVTLLAMGAVIGWVGL